MENLLTHMRMVHRTSVMLVLGYLLSYTAMAMASAMFQDQVPNWVTDKSYFTSLNTFRGQSLTAMSLSRDGMVLYLGGKNTFYVMDLRQPFGQPSAIRNVSWVSEDSVVNSCTMKGKQGWQCQNFIQVVLKNEETDRLLVCGTNAWAPSCRNFQPNSWDRYEVFSGNFRCPFSPAQRSTALFAEGALYTATVTSFTAVDSVIFRSMKGDPIRSKEVDTKWLKVPEFIKSFEVGDWVMFFLREIAVEHVNSGEAIYSRVAKVCKSDMGGGWVLDGTWTTFQKARLNCSFPGAFPFYFNYLQDVYMVGEGDNITFYGVFTTGDHEIPGSAVCVFSLSEIKRIINEGQFKKQQQGTWYPVPADEVPAQRPGDCSVDSLTMPDTTLNFILEHPLMHQSVPNLNDDRPRFDLTRADYRIVQIVVHQQRAANGKTYDVLFLGTDDGRVLKAVIVYEVHEDGTKEYRSNLLEEIFVSPRTHPEGVVNMEIVRSPSGQEMILVNTNSTVVELPLQRCRNLTKCACRQDPYCVFNNLSQTCLQFTTNDYDSQDVDNIQDCPKEVAVPQTTTPVECFCPTAQPCVKTGKDCDGDNTDNLPSSLLTTTTSALWSPTGKRSTEAITTPSKGTTSQSSGSRTSTVPVRTPRPTTMSNEIDPPPGKTLPPKEKTPRPNAVDPLVGGSVGQPQAYMSPVFWTLFSLGWVTAVVLVVILLHVCVSRKCKGNYQPTDTEESVLGSSYKSSPAIVKTVLPKENGKPPLVTSMQESPVRVVPSNGSLPQSRAHSLTPSVDPSVRNSNGSYRPHGSFTYGMDNSYLTPYSSEKRHPPTGGVPVELGSPPRLPSESESRPSASGASDTELFADDSEIWLKRPDGTDFGQEHEV